MNSGFNPGGNDVENIFSGFWYNIRQKQYYKLDYPGAAYTIGYGIGNDNTVVRDYFVASTGTQYGFIWTAK
jgi:hypothetical protein